MTGGTTRWGWGIASLAIFAVVALIVSYLLRSSKDSIFSIAARTDVIVVEPSCSDRLIWDLPPGWVLVDKTLLESRPLDEGAGAASPLPVSVELAAGARATVMREASGTWKIRLERGSAFEQCEPAPPTPLRVVVGGTRLTPDAVGYTYQSLAGNPAVVQHGSIAPTAMPIIGPAPPLTLRLGGRILLGQPIIEGGGWGTASQPLLHSANVEVRGKAFASNTSLSVLVEEIGPGSTIDTHSCITSETVNASSRCALERSHSGRSAGFMYYPNSEGAMFAQVHRTSGEIGVVPYGGLERTLEVTNWEIVVKTPWVQSTVAGLVLVSALLQGLIAFRDSWPRRPERRVTGEQRDAT